MERVQFAMIDATDFGATESRWRDFRASGLISTAHFMSHVFHMLLPPVSTTARGREAGR
jgi:hypothetical protein